MVQPDDLTHEVGPDRDEAFAGQLRERVAALDWPAFLAFAEVHVLNGEYRLVMGGCRNHRGETASDLNELLMTVGKDAPVSYGVMYWRDPEAGTNDFTVRVMARGRLVDHPDPFLSSVVSTVEDEEPFEE